MRRLGCHSVYTEPGQDAKIEIPAYRTFPQVGGGDPPLLTRGVQNHAPSANLRLGQERGAAHDGQISAS